MGLATTGIHFHEDANHRSLHSVSLRCKPQEQTFSFMGLQTTGATFSFRGCKPQGRHHSPWGCKPQKQTSLDMGLKTDFQLQTADSDRSRHPVTSSLLSTATDIQLQAATNHRSRHPIASSCKPHEQTPSCK